MAANEEKEYGGTGREVTLIDRVFDTMIRGVVVITTRQGEKINGLSACWVNRSADQPFLIAASIWKQNLSHEMIRQSGIFAVHVLRSDQVQLARHFGKQSGRQVDKFATVSYHTGKTGAPILTDCRAYLDCRVVSSTDSGDHTMFIGEVQEGEIVSRGEPLAFQRQDYLDDPSTAPAAAQKRMGQRMFKITVKEIQGRGTCNFGFKKGDVILHPDTSPPRTIPNFCAWAYHEIHPALFTLKFGGSFPWETEKNVAVACCSDSRNPVVFRIELIENP